MENRLPALRREERVSLRLRALYEENGYRLFRLGSFEEYDLYMQNRPFLTDGDIITFNGADGRLLALKPDVTLSIVKNTRPDETQRVYYAERVFRRSRSSGEYREISQVGLEFIGAEGPEDEAKVLRLAAQSLAEVGPGALDLSHMALIEVVLDCFGQEDAKEKARGALQSKSPHGMRQVAAQAGLSDEKTDMLVEFVQLAGPFKETLQKARKLTDGVAGAAVSLDELEQLSEAVEGTGTQLRLDFSILNDAGYYNGLIFKGFVQGVPGSVLSGGRYDNLLRRFDKPQGALGFALYLDNIEGVSRHEQPSQRDSALVVALPKGRLGNAVYALLEKAGLAVTGLLDSSRKLVFEDEQNNVRYLLVKPSDVHSYVEHGATDIGVVGRDVLIESGADVLELLDLGLGKCRLAVAGPADFEEDPARVLRVASKYPNTTRRYYASKSRSVEIIGLHGSIELAPITGLSDVIVDIVETGSTLYENNLTVLEEVEPSSARLIANRTAWRFKQDQIQNLAEKVARLVDTE